MATTYNTIRGYLDEEYPKYQYHIDAKLNLLSLVFPMDYYVDADGEHSLDLLIKLEEDGKFLKVFAPEIYQYKDGPH